MTSVRLNTGIWYDERSVEIEFPPQWDVVTHWPRTPEPLTEQQIARRIDEPIGARTIVEQATGKKTVAIVVDDLSRPTPAYRVLPLVLDRLRAAGIPQHGVSIVVATGTHGGQDASALRKKVGERAATECRVEVHDDLKNVKYIGKTSFETPVYVNRNVLNADLVLGVGGVYPQHTTGFGGGGKLALGVCGRQTIMGLHYKHKSMEGRYDTNNDFRKDVCEVARMIGLDSSLTVHIDAFSNVVNVLFGSHADYYDSAAAFSKDNYTAPVAGTADMVVANAYPLDTSFTFMRKGYKPLYTAPKSAVKVMVAAAHEGIGVHGLFQHINPSRLVRLRNLYLRAASLGPREVAKKVVSRIARKLAPQRRAAASAGQERVTVLPPNTEHLYVWRTDAGGVTIPPIEGLTVMDDWPSLLEAIRQRHFRDQAKVRVSVYPCAPIQCLDDDGSQSYHAGD